MRACLRLAPFATVFVVLLACGSSRAPDPAVDPSEAGTTPTPPGPSFGEGGTDGSGCVNLECKQVPCSGGAKTTVRGVVYDPSGTLPLYNVVVYVPNAPVAPITTGATCDTCGASVTGSPLVSTLTNTKGEFVLENVPVGDNIPLVMQVGKWRRQITLPSVKACVDTPLADKNVTRLPRKQSEGHIPKIAMATGEADALECLLRKIGIDDSEFTPESGTGRVNLYAGGGGTNRYQTLNGGATFTGAVPFWDDLAKLNKYDVLLLSCEGAFGDHTLPAYVSNKSAQAHKAMLDYTSQGGRVFASHWHHVWAELGPAPLPSVFSTLNHTTDVGGATGDIDVSFPKGQAFADWLDGVGASSPTKGKISLGSAQHTIDAVNPAVAQRWISTSSPTTVQYMTFNTPVGSNDKACGRMVVTDIHVSSGDTSGPGVPFPSGCTTTGLSAQEKALVFMLFDLSSCIQADKDPPKPPK